jgi:hypothetical protein
MKITKFEIQLQNPQPVYYAGQTIAGQVFIELAKELDFRAITLALHGDANVSLLSIYHLSLNVTMDVISRLVRHQHSCILLDGRLACI